MGEGGEPGLQRRELLRGGEWAEVSWGRGTGGNGTLESQRASERKRHGEMVGTSPQVSAGHSTLRTNPGDR